MNWITSIETAVEYIENNLLSRLDYEDIAACAYCSSHHFQRMFSVFSGYTLGEYIRARRMTLAGAELKGSDIKILDLAIKYGYENPESFTRAFTKFHGITPSQARKTDSQLKSFSRLSNYESDEGGNLLDYRIIDLDRQVFIGCKTHFEGTPYSEERRDQEEELFLSTRNMQWMLKGMSAACSDSFNESLDYCIIDNFEDDGYDFYYAQPMNTLSLLDDITIKQFCVDKISLPQTTYAVFKTQSERYPTEGYIKMCRQIFCEWLPSTNYQLLSGPELIVYHWYNDRKEDRYIEVYIPVKLENEDCSIGL
ncbi:MAG: AraC family transcriptional regulator [Eubacterium sp.]|nr:AraC family transcriptional regulator [Eubacterium sp.]